MVAYGVCFQRNALSRVGLVSWCWRNMRPPASVLNKFHRSGQFEMNYVGLLPREGYREKAIPSDFHTPFTTWVERLGVIRGHPETNAAMGTQCSETRRKH
jgi:hypothetical protein